MRKKVLVYLVRKKQVHLNKVRNQCVQPCSGTWYHKIKKNRFLKISAVTMAETPKKGTPCISHFCSRYFFPLKKGVNDYCWVKRLRWKLFHSSQEKNLSRKKRNSLPNNLTSNSWPKVQKNLIVKMTLEIFHMIIAWSSHSRGQSKG